VRYFLDAAGDQQPGGGLSPQTRIASIGPVTSETLREHGLTPDVEAARHDIDGLLEAIVADAAAGER
jgi:uroporphyrinogen III methyltransferase / synthase